MMMVSIRNFLICFDEQCSLSIILLDVLSGRFRSSFLREKPFTKRVTAKIGARTKKMRSCLIGELLGHLFSIECFRLF